MVKRKKNKSKQRPKSGFKSVQHSDVKTLEQRATQHLHKHRYKDALHDYKLLLKQDPQDNQYQLALLSAYQGRSRQLAEKKMFKEACVIWENMQGFVKQNEALQGLSAAGSESSPSAIDYLQWHLFSGNLQKALQLFQQYEPKIKTHSKYADLCSHFAAQLLSAPEQSIKILDVNHPLRSHWYYAREALKAFCSEKPETMQQALKNIPYRSAYKDFSLILKALVLMQAATEQNATDQSQTDSAEQSRDLLDEVDGLFKKITKDSGFYPFARNLLPLNSADEVLITALLNSGSQMTLLYAEFLGWSKNTLKEWNRAKQRFSGHHKNKFELFRWILQTRLTQDNAYKEAVLKEIAKGLFYQFTGEINAYQRRFGDLDLKERYRIAAVIAEQNHDFEYAVYDWEKYLEESDDPLEKAMIYRKLSELTGRVDEYEREYSPEDYLLKSLEYEPDEKSAYLRLFELYSQSYSENLSQNTNKNKPSGRQKKAHQQLVANALRYFPTDREVLAAAIKESQQRKVFKKASSLAKQLLKIDPTNSFARQMLVDSSLAHARKNLLGKKNHLAEKEINTAAEIDPNSGRVEIFKALLSIVQQEPMKNATNHVIQAVAQLENPLLCRLIIHTELLFLGLFETASRPLMQGLKGLNRSERPVGDLMAELFEQIKRYKLENIAEFFEAMLNSEKLFKDLCKNIKEKEQRLKIAGLLIQYQFFPLAEWFIKADRQLFNNEPLMQYYYVLAGSEAQAKKIDHLQFERLERAYDDARDNGDNDTARLILNLLVEAEDYQYSLPSKGPKPPKLPDFIENFELDEDDELDDMPIPVQGELFEMMDEILNNMSDKEKQELFKKIEQAEKKSRRF